VSTTTTAQPAIDEVDLADVRHFAEGPPLDLFARMREQAPVHWNPPGAHPDGFFSITRYDDVVPVAKDWRTWSSQRGMTMVEGSVLPSEASRLLFPQMDPPEHTKHRGILQKVFTAHAVARLAPDLERIAHRLIDEVIERGECDLVSEIAVDFPLTVTATMLGVPHADRHRLFHWTNQMADTELPQSEMLGVFVEMAEYVATLVAHRRANPGDDWLSRLIAAEVDGHRLSDAELVVNFALLMVGGNETARNGFAGGMRALIENPAQRAMLIAEPARIGTAVEEILRYTTPLLHVARTATRDTEIAGVSIREGQRVVLWQCAANRDPAANADPDRFDITRSRVNHTAFGPGGIHFCLGNQLARLELSVLVPAVLDRMRELALAGPVTHKPSTFVNWILTLPVTFTPARRRDASDALSERVLERCGESDRQRPGEDRGVA
jgi:cytochrome P450